MTAANGVCKAVSELDELVGKIENGEAVETKQIHDQTGKTENNEEEIQQSDDQNGKGENPTESESFAGAVENEESEIRVLELGTELGEIVEVNNSSPDIIVSGDDNDESPGYDVELASSDQLELDEGSLNVVAEVLECEGANGRREDDNLELGSVNVITEAGIECDDVKDKCDDRCLDLESSSEFDNGSPNVTFNVITEDVVCNDLELASSDKLGLDEGSLNVVAEAVECEEANARVEDHNLDLGSSAKWELDQESLDVVKEAVECDDAKDKCEHHNVELITQVIECDDAKDKCEGVITEAIERDNARDKCEAAGCGSPKVEVGKEVSGETLHLDPKYWPLISDNTKIDFKSCQTLHSTRWADMVTKVVPRRVKKGKKDNSTEAHAQNTDPRPKEPVEHPDSIEESPETVRCEISIDSISKVDELHPEIENSDAKTTEDVSVIDDESEGARSTTGFYLVKIPRFDDGKLTEQMKRAELEVDEKTQLRDAIQCQIQKTRLKSSTHSKVEELQVQYRDADLSRQAAHSELQRLRKELYEKNKHFRAYMCDAVAAKDCASKKDREGLHCLCTKQVEDMMKLWNTNDEFRNEYVKNNATSTVRRLGTLDGRSVGPEEAPPILPDVDEKFGKAGPTQPSPSLKLREHKFHKATDKEPDKLVMRNAFAAIFGEDLTDEIEMNGMKSKKEVERERKAKEKCREEAEAKLKEQLRLEEIAKAKLELERKERKAEKAKRRAQLRAQKEAEQKQKEKEKLKKKEIVAVPPTREADGRKNIYKTVQSSEIQTETVNETKSATTKRVPRESRPRCTMPPAVVRSRNKKRSWWRLCVILAFFIGVVLFRHKITGFFTVGRQMLESWFLLCTNI